MPAQRGHHPALARFLTWSDSSTRLLLIRAAPGTGREWFAKSWIGDRSGEVHDWTATPGNESMALGALFERLREDESLHLAVILAPSTFTWDLVSIGSVLLAEQRDLLLEVGEIGWFAEGLAMPNSARDVKINALCGGWLGGARILLKDARADFQAQYVIRNGLAVWLEHQDPSGALTEAAFLTSFDAQTVEAFYGEFSATPHTLDELVDAGLLRRDDNNEWMMPTMVRKVLVERAGILGRERVGILKRASVNAVSKIHGIESAADSAVSRGWWPSLLNLLLERWVELFINNPKYLSALMAKIPHFVSEQTEYLWLGLRLLGTAGKNGIAIQLPAVKPDYSTDRAAQRLNQEVIRLYRRPNIRAMTMGMLETVQLRTGGMYVEAGTSAAQLRSALHRGMGTHNFKPALVSLVEIQAGISLQLAGRTVEAREAYEMSLHWAQASGQAFLLADAAGKLALLNTLETDVLSALECLRVHDAAIDQVTWGRPMLARSAALARAYVAVASFDFDAVDRALAPLPSAPDNDEFWAVHTHLLATVKIRRGIPQAARSLVDLMRRQRRFAAAAPMAAALLDDVLLMAATLERFSMLPVGESSAGDPALVALGHLLDGNADAALTVLNASIESPRIRGGGNLVHYLDLAARNPAGPTPELLARVRSLHEDSGQLAEIVYLMMVPGWAEVGSLLGLDPDAARRLEAAGIIPSAPLPKRPALTPRELEVLAQLRAGMTRREIAAVGYRSENTVKTQIRSLYRKLEVADLGQMLERAREWGL
ncbi:MAG: LuxR C-terminal-related transcriptional regulator [Paeniglutamicibacter terrestris]